MINDSVDNMSSVSKKYISLREVGRQLGVPPSTIVYYKDRFSRFIPSEGGGRRRKYPAEVLEVFRRIREMFNKNWPIEKIERELALKFSFLMGDQQSDQQEGQLYDPVSPDGFAREVGGVLAKLTGVLEDQTLFRSEIRSLRDEVTELRRERMDSEFLHAERIAELESELGELRRKLSGHVGGRMIDFPSEEFLSSPLVIRSGGEYLGVQGKGKQHFSLKDFVHLVERKVTDVMEVETSWKRQDDHWVLLIKTEDSVKGRVQDIVMVATATVTPSNNTVTEIVRLNIDGNDAPDALLLTLFRQLKGVFNG